jgi:hypothetical protein
MTERLIEKLDRLGAEAGIQGMTPEIRRFALLVRADMVAQPVQEPVAWMVYTQEGQSVYVTDNPTDIQEGQRALPLYTSPPQRPWVDLGDSQIEQVYYDVAKLHRGAPMPWGQVQFGKALQALIKEKNT